MNDHRYRRVAFSAPLPLSLGVPLSSALRTSHQPVCAKTPPPSNSPSDGLYVDPSPRAGRVQLSPRGNWTNPARRVLTDLGSGLHAIERSYLWLQTFDVGGRCTLIETENGLIVYSPLPLTSAIRRAIDAVGQVSVVLAPNNEHVDFVRSFAAAYPNAVILGPPGCRARWPALPFSGEAYSDGKPHPAISLVPDILPLFVPGAPFFDETLLFHKPSCSLLICDLWWNFPKPAAAAAAGVEISGPTILFATAMDRVYAPVYNRILVRDRASFRRFFKKLRNLDIERIIPCHGDVVERDGKQMLENFFPKYLKPGL